MRFISCTKPSPVSGPRMGTETPSSRSQRSCGPQLDLQSDSPPLYSVNDSGATTITDEITKIVQEEIATHSKELHSISIYLSDHPEIGYEEHKAHAKVTKYLKSEGFEVEGFDGLDTAFRVSYTQGSGGRVFGLNSEFDALPRIGHACGHNLICVAGIAALLAIRKVMQRLDVVGTVVLLGTPAEEGGEGKIKLLKAGAYDSMDVCMMTHPDAQPYGQHSVLPSLAIQSIWAEYQGVPSQASAQPWEGINALDAVHVAYGAISALRQQLRPTDRVHGIITNGGAAANIIPDLAEMKYFIRAPSASGVVELRKKVLPCFEAAAIATGCKVKITKDDLTYDQRNVVLLANEYATCVKRMFGTSTYINVKADSGGVSGGLASTDFGNVTYALPSCHTNFGIPTINGRSNHTFEFAQAARSDQAHEEAWKSAAGLACVGIRVLQDKAFANEVKAWWKADHKKDARVE